MNSFNRKIVAVVHQETGVLWLGISMKKKMLKLNFLFVLSLLVLTACDREKEEKPVSEGEVTITVSPSIAPTEVIQVTEAPQENNNDDSLLTEEEAFELAKTYVGEIAQYEFSNIVDHFTEEEKVQITEDYLSSTWTSYVKDLGDYIGIKTQDVKVEDTSITVVTLMEYQNNGLSLTLTFTNEQKIQSIFFQYKSLEEEAVSDLYKEIDIQIGQGEYLLDGKLTLPMGVEKPPVVILVQGYGQSDYDETIGASSNKPFRDIANGLAEQGIASIRYNKRFYQYADKANINATIYEEVLDDVSYAIDFASKDTRVDGAKIYIIGHSLGGMLCPKIASDNEQVAGFISLAGSPRRLENIIYDQVLNALLKEENLTEDERTKIISQYDDALLQIKNLSNDNLGEAILGVTGYYWKSLNNIDSIKLVGKLEIPMLFLQGSADFQVFADKDFLQWENILKGNDNASFKLYEGLNHLFMTTNGLTDTTEYDVEGTVNEQVINDMTEWILGQK